jgi:hypothetical protein
VTLAGGERAVAALPAGHPHASADSLALGRVAPERVIVLPRDSNPAFHNAVVAMCRDAGLSPELAEVGEARTDHALLAVASGAGMALLPESATQRHVVPGVRFVPIDRPEPAFESAVLTLPGTGDTMATARFLRAVSQAVHARQAAASAVPLAA